MARKRTTNKEKAYDLPDICYQCRFFYDHDVITMKGRCAKKEIERRVADYACEQIEKKR